MNAATVNSNVYKVLPQSSRTLTIKLTTLRIGNIQYNNRVTVNASGRQFAAGGNYKITVKITGNGITVGGATWAKGASSIRVISGRESILAEKRSTLCTTVITTL